MNARTVAALLLTAAVTLPTLGQTPAPAPAATAKPAETHATYEPRGLPGAGQQLLAQFAGDWNVVKTFHPVTGDPVSTKGTCVQRMIQGGRFLQSDFTFFDAKKGTSTGTGISGFDPKTNKFTTVWYDSNQTTMSIRQSNGTFDGKEVVLYATNLDPDRPGRRTVTRAHLEKDGQVLVHRHFLIQDDGTERLMIEFYFTRKPTAAAKKR